MRDMTRDAIASPSETSAETLDSTTARTPKGRFAPGSCGNPRGRPRGSRNKTKPAHAEFLDGEVEALTGKMIALALGGDEKAMTFCLQRVMAPLKERPLDFDLPPIATLADADAALSMLIAAMNCGEIEPKQAQRLAEVVDRKRKALQSCELEQRIHRMEAHLAKTVGFQRQPIYPKKHGSRQPTEALLARMYRIMDAVVQAVSEKGETEDCQPYGNAL